jgi:hypothetical protein
MGYSEQIIVKRWIPIFKEREGTKAKENPRLLCRPPGKGVGETAQRKWTGVSPASAYWNYTELVSDNRIAAFAEDTTSCEFIQPENGKVVITVSLLYRLAFVELMEQKKWNVPHILLAQKKIIVTKR